MRIRRCLHNVAGEQDYKVYGVRNQLHDSKCKTDGQMDSSDGGGSRQHKEWRPKRNSVAVKSLFLFYSRYIQSDGQLT